MPGLPVASQGRVSRNVANAPIIAEGQPGDVRLGSRGDPYLLSPFNGLHATGVERSYFTTVQEGTRGTGITISTTTTTSYSATAGILLVVNANAPGGPDVIMDVFSIKIDAIAGGAPTFWNWYHALDIGNRHSSGGVQTNAYNADGSQPPGVLIYSGAEVLTAATSQARDVGFNCVANGASVANAVHSVRYGRLDSPPAGTFTIPTTGVAQSTFDCPPVVIPPGWCYMINEFWVGRTTTALLGEIFVGFVVR